MITAAYTLLTLIVLAVCGLAAAVRPQAREVLAAAIFVLLVNYSLMIGIEVLGLAGYPLKPPANMLLYPLADLACVCMIGFSILRQSATWKFALMFGLLALLVGHCAFWSSWEGSRYGSGGRQIYHYVAFCNVWNFYALVVLLLSGGGHVKAWVVSRSWVPERGNLLRPVRGGRD